MKKEFYLFRHGQTDWNLEKRCQGHTDIPLNKNGLKEAKELSIKLDQIPLEVIYSSDLKRAIQTAEFLSTKKKVPLLLSKNLREFSLGIAEGKSHDELVSTYGIELWENFLSINCEKNNIAYPKGETRHQVLQRTMKILNTIACESSYKSIGIAIFFSDNALSDKINCVAPSLTAIKDSSKILSKLSLRDFSYEKVQSIVFDFLSNKLINF